MFLFIVDSIAVLEVFDQTEKCEVSKRLCVQPSRPFYWSPELNRLS